MALTFVWRLDPSSPEPFSVLTDVLSQLGTAGRYELVRPLGELGASGRPAVPALRQLLHSRGIMMHDYAREALETIAPEFLSDSWK